MHREDGITYARPYTRAERVEAKAQRLVPFVYQWEYRGTAMSKGAGEATVWVYSYADLCQLCNFWSRGDWFYKATRDVDREAMEAC